KNRADAQDLKIVGRDDAAGNPFGMVAEGEGGASDVLGDEGVEQCAALGEVLEVGPGDVRSPIAIDAGEGNHAVLVGDEGEGTQQDSFDPAEDGGGRADAQGKAEERQK